MAFVCWIRTFEGKKGTGKERNVESELVSELVRELHSLGAIPIGKTTLVQSLWVSTHQDLKKIDEEIDGFDGKAPETNNNIVGYIFNPYNQLLSTGGSSGGNNKIIVVLALC
jgi:amidase